MGFPRQEHWSGLPFPFPGESSWTKDPTCNSRVSFVASGGSYLFIYRKRREMLENLRPPGSALKQWHKCFSSLYTHRNNSRCELQLTLEHQDFELWGGSLARRLFSVVNTTRLRDMQVG